MADVKRKYNVETTLTAQKVCQLIDDGKINDLPLIVKHDILYSDAPMFGYKGSVVTSSQFNNMIRSTALDSSRVLVIASGTSGVSAVILTINNDSSITAGTKVVFDSIDYCFVSVSALSSNLAIAITSDNTTTFKVRALSCIGNVISIAATNTSTACRLFDLGAVSLDASRVLICYDGASGLNARVISYNESTTTITIGTALSVNAGASYGQSLKLVFVGGGKVFVPYLGANSYMNAVILTSASGTSISAGSNLIINSTGSTYPLGVMLDSNTFFITARNSSVGTTYSYKLSLSGTTLSISLTHSTFSSNWLLCADKITSSKVLVLGYDGNVLTLDISSADIVLATVGSIGGVAGTDSQHFTRRSDYKWTTVSYYNLSGSYYTNIYATNIYSEVAAPAETRNGKVIGVSLDAAGNIQLKGKCKALTGLTPGSKYYFDANGVISTTATGTFLGVALSATELSIPDYLIN